MSNNNTCYTCYICTSPSYNRPWPCCKCLYSLSKREDSATSVECYMKQYGVTEEEEEAKMELTKEMNDAWKDIINQECLHLHSSTTITKPLLVLIPNLACSGEVRYNNYQDMYTHSHSAQGFSSFSIYRTPACIRLILDSLSVLDLVS